MRKLLPLLSLLILLQGFSPILVQAQTTEQATVNTSCHLRIEPATGADYRKIADNTEIPGDTKLIIGKDNRKKVTITFEQLLNADVDTLQTFEWICDDITPMPPRCENGNSGIFSFTSCVGAPAGYSCTPPNFANANWDILRSSGQRIEITSNCQLDEEEPPAATPAANLDYIPLEPIPGFTEQGGTGDLTSLLGAMFRILIVLGALIAVTTLIIGGTMYMLGESLVKIDKARTIIRNGFYGLLLLIGAWLILNTINPDLVELRAIRPIPTVIPGQTGTTTPLAATGWSTGGGMGDSIATQIRRSDLYRQKEYTGLLNALPGIAIISRNENASDQEFEQLLYRFMEGCAEAGGTVELYEGDDRDYYYCGEAPMPPIEEFSATNSEGQFIFSQARLSTSNSTGVKAVLVDADGVAIVRLSGNDIEDPEFVNYLEDFEDACGAAGGSVGTYRSIGSAQNQNYLCTKDAPPATASCSLNGATVAHNTSTTTYQASSVPAGSSCVSQTRTCTNGTLSGTYIYTNCTIVGGDPSIVKEGVLGGSTMTAVRNSISGCAAPNYCAIAERYIYIEQADVSNPNNTQMLQTAHSTYTEWCRTQDPPGTTNYDQGVVVGVTGTVVNHPGAYVLVCRMR